ncbi:MULTISPECIES: tryptophan 2,3-dioxygenase family protein [Micromonospora]|uniref:Tryptophan 2,3-dioxygenase (Vermilion) n=1 Tax=Micromonospora yangpuensis TaxID=683228 RepID=A0A1C6UU67_9ACTN|nr:tryptophan 2,3-dioxygenase family protein [Micromonospora yangpuensis]GGM24722.1 hypothetical protein GCM10012279_48970 [Micromonospora yangpuensis]SCL57369.1 Tryptophan 2,3-dioxygenase (vermilion) [Micromonospora yangpuensis]
MRDVTRWLSGAAEPDSFPYSPVLREFHRVGKHFVAPDLLALLDQSRIRVRPAADRPTGDARLLCDFLDVALDKWDGRYDYRSYLALPVLRLTGPPRQTDDAVEPTDARRARDRLLVGLVADALAFELAAGVDTDLLAELRPGPQVVAKRCRLGLRAVRPALGRLGLTTTTVAEPAAAAAAAALHAMVTALDDPTDRQALRLSMLPVYVSHDEYLFIRVLQAYECLFVGLAAELHATIAALAAGAARTAAERLAYARELLSTASPLFSLLATMQPAAFRTFRAYTEGASAIQSRSYKLMESLCRTPDRSRLDSAAYRSVPEVRDRVRAGQPSVDEAYRAAVRGGRLDAAEQALLVGQLHGFSTAVLQWRRTHHGLATRMLGPRPGTGYTEGTPYLAATRGIAVFTAVAPESGAPSPTEPTGGCPA